MRTSNYPFFGRIAALRGARSCACLLDVSPSLRPVRLAPCPEMLNSQRC
jgi:hypothetical protein